MEIAGQRTQRLVLIPWPVIGLESRASSFTNFIISSNTTVSRVWSFLGRCFFTCSTEDSVGFIILVSFIHFSATD